MLTYATRIARVLPHTPVFRFFFFNLEQVREALVQMLRLPAARAVGRRHAVCSRMLTYAHVCSRMLTYADATCARGARGGAAWLASALPPLAARHTGYLSIYIYICMCVYIYICIYICARDVEVAPYKSFRLPYELEELLLP
jgi:hypothetical protein